MIMKLTLLLILTTSLGYSQNTIPITKEQALEAIRNAQRVESLQTDLRSADVLILSQGELIATLKSEVSNRELIIKLTNNNYDILEAQYEALKKNKNPSYNFGDFLKDAGKVLIGVVIGIGAILVL